ncbi:YtxH-like protein [compost metagenome]
MENFKTMIAFCAGVAVGAAIGAFTAPEKGSELRRRMVDRMKKTGNDLVNNVKGGLDDLTSTITSKMKDVGNETTY